MLITSEQEQKVTEGDRAEEIETLCERLVLACGQMDLTSHTSSGSGEVYAGAPGIGMLSEVVKCQPDATGALLWYWSWGVPFCAAAEIAKAAEMIAHVVAPAHA